MTELSVDRRQGIAVDPDYYFNPDMDACPLGVKVQLLNEGDVAVYGTVTPTTRSLWNGWAPMPKIRKYPKGGVDGTESATKSSAGTVRTHQQSDVASCNASHVCDHPDAGGRVCGDHAVA